METFLSSGWIVGDTEVTRFARPTSVLPLYDNSPDIGPRVLRSSVSDSAICTQKGIRVMSTTFAIRGNARSSKETCCAMKHFSRKLP
jgi:hypothetical protein